MAYIDKSATDCGSTPSQLMSLDARIRDINSTLARAAESLSETSGRLFGTGPSGGEVKGAPKAVPAGLFGECNNSLDALEATVRWVGEKAQSLASA